MLAAGQGHLEIVQELLKEGSDPNQSMNDGTTPLYYCFSKKNIEIVKYLLAHKEINITKPLIKTKEDLQKFARNKTPLDSDLILRMDNYIADYKLKYPSKTMIKITPKDIAFIMGHSSILEPFEPHHLQQKKPENR